MKSSRVHSHIKQKGSLFKFEQIQFESGGCTQKWWRPTNYCVSITASSSLSWLNTFKSSCSLCTCKGQYRGLNSNQRGRGPSDCTSRCEPPATQLQPNNCNNIMDSSSNSVDVNQLNIYPILLNTFLNQIN